MELKEHVDTFEGWAPYAVIILNGIESQFHTIESDHKNSLSIILDGIESETPNGHL